MGYIDENLERYVERFAREDQTDPEAWYKGAVRGVVARRASLEAAMNGTEFLRVDGFGDDESSEDRGNPDPEVHIGEIELAVTDEMVEAMCAAKYPVEWSPERFAERSNSETWRSNVRENMRRYLTAALSVVPDESKAQLTRTRKQLRDQARAARQTADRLRQENEGLREQRTENEALALTLVRYLNEAHPHHTNSDICPVCIAMAYTRRTMAPSEGMTSGEES